MTGDPPTRVDDGDEPSTLDAPLRWSGAAAVPPQAPKKAWWTRRRAPADEWEAVPAVDPWEGQDTPIDPFPAVPEEAPAPPPTKVEPPRISKREQKAREKAARERALHELNAARRRLVAVTPPVNRLPVQPRTTPPPGPPGATLPPPPPWVPRPTQRPLPPPPRKRRRWGRRFALLSLFGLICCCGAPIAWFQFPTVRQYPVSASLPSSFADLTRREGNASTRAAERLAEELRAANARTDGVFAGVYGDGRGKRVTVFGVTGLRFTPGSDVRAQMENLAGDFDLSRVETFDLDEPGAHERCGVGRVDGDAVVVCSWADHGSLATVLLTRRSLSDSADLVGRLRSEVLSPG